MKHVIFILSIVLFSPFIYSQDFAWACGIGGASGDLGKDIAIDVSGNVYTTGSFEGTADFDPGIGTYNLTSNGQGDIFICKLDSYGNFVWAKSMGSSYSESGTGIAVDVAGNVYTTGYFSLTVDFDPGSGTFNLTAPGSGRDIFVSKLDASGNFIWAKKMGGNDRDEGYSIALDASANVYTTGNFEGTADFDPGTGTFNLSSVGNSDIFISKLNASGSFLWAKKFGGTSSDYGRSIALDASGNVHTTGKFRGTVDFDPGSGTYNLTANYMDVFVSKLDVSGNFVWAKNMGGSGEEFGYGISVDASGNVYTTGTFKNTADFDPGAGTYNLISTGSGSNDIFVSKLDISGNFVWAKNMGSTGNDYAFGISLDAAGNVFTTGRFEGTADFDPGTGTFNLVSVGTYDIFISKLDASGNFIWAKQIGGSSWDGGSSITVDDYGNEYIIGFFQGTVDFDPGTGTAYLTSVGATDIFINKYGTFGPLPVALLNFEAKIADDIVNLYWQTTFELNNDYFSVERCSDGYDFTEIGQLSGCGSSNQNRKYKLTDYHPDMGINYYRLKQVDFNGEMCYSPIVIVDMKNVTGNVLEISNVFPNPFNNSFIVNYFIPDCGSIEILLVSQTGELFYHKIFNVNIKEQSTTISGFNEIPSGVYLLIIKMGSQTSTVKIEKY
jgi:Beta-propeller repeat